MGHLLQVKYYFENRISTTTIRPLDGKHIYYIAASNGNTEIWIGKFTKELNFYRTLQITGVLIEAKLIITAHWMGAFDFVLLVEQHPEGLPGRSGARQTSQKTD